MNIKTIEGNIYSTINADQLIDGSPGTVTIVNDNEMKFAKGDILAVVDPCYIMPDRIGDTIAHLKGYEDTYQHWSFNGLASVKIDDRDIKLIYTGTAHGDGGYDVAVDPGHCKIISRAETFKNAIGRDVTVPSNEFGVDSGTYCIMKWEDAMYLLETRLKEDFKQSDLNRVAIETKSKPQDITEYREMRKQMTVRCMVKIEILSDDASVYVDEGGNTEDSIMITTGDY